MRPTTPLLAVDLVIELDGHAGRRIVLIKRRNPPDGWALPGGFVDVGETMEQAARREALEETGLEVRLETLLGCYSDPGRDARGHTVSAVYVAQAAGEPRGGDDAREAIAADPSALPPLAFDHERILADYRRFRDTGKRPRLEEPLPHPLP